MNPARLFTRMEAGDVDRILIVGVDCQVGQALTEYLANRAAVEAAWISRPPVSSDINSISVSDPAFADQVGEADVVVFCGGAAESSWNAGFGRLKPESKWLRVLVDQLNSTTTRLVYVSSDSVFGGPWIFHNDDSQSFSDDSTARQIRKWEELVASVDNSLIVRTNVPGRGIGSESFCERIAERLAAGESEQVDGGRFATPVSSLEFSRVLTEALAVGMSGYLNIGGAERTSPFRFATALAAALDYDNQHLIPRKPAEPVCESSLRCQRLRKALEITAPLLRDTINDIVESLIDKQQNAVAA